MAEWGSLSFRKPGGWTSDDAVMRTVCYLVREATVGRKIAWDVLVERCMPLQVAAYRLVWIEHDNVSSTSSANVFDWSNQIGIARNDDERISLVLVEIRHHCSRKVHI